MLEDLRQRILSVVSGVFETMFFIILEPIEGDEHLGLPKEKRGSLENGSPLFFKSEIGFQGDYSGKITLFLPSSLGRSMTVNFLGLEENEISEPQALDMTGEIANMISGNLFSLLNKREGFKLTVPKTEVILDLDTREQNHDFPGSCVVDFYGEEQKIRVKIQFDS
jgi:CheY-specific phosphatase CheX